MTSRAEGGDRIEAKDVARPVVVDPRVLSEDDVAFALGPEQAETPIPGGARGEWRYRPVWGVKRITEVVNALLAAQRREIECGSDHR